MEISSEKLQRSFRRVTINTLVTFPKTRPRKAVYSAQSL